MNVFTPYRRTIGNHSVMIFVYKQTKHGVGQTPHILRVLTGVSRRYLHGRAVETLLYQLTNERCFTDRRHH